MRPVLITGPPGIGKSTLINGLLEGTEPNAVAGVLSGEIRVEGRRQGFTVQSVGGKPGILAGPLLPGEPRFGTLMPDGRRRLGLSLSHLETVVCPEVRRGLPGARFVVLDEIGPMQAESSEFRDLVQTLLGSSVPVVASIGQQDHEWLNHLRNDRRYALVELTDRNRDLIAEMLAPHLRWRSHGTGD